MDTIDEPPLSDVIHVGMNQFGYIGPSEQKQWIDTFGLAPCIGVHVYSPTTGYQLFMHSSGNMLWQAQELIRYARNNGMVAEKEGGPLCFDEQVTIYASAYASEDNVVEIQNGLKWMGCRNVEVVTSPEEDSIDVIFNSKGERYWLNPKSLAPRVQTDLDIARMRANAFDPSSLRCVNTGETLHKENYESILQRRLTEHEPDLSGKIGFKKIFPTDGYFKGLPSV